MLRELNFSPKNSFYIWFDKKYKKEYYIAQLSMCKTKFVKEKDNKFNSIKLIKSYSNKFNEEKTIYYSSSDIINPFEENYGMFLINFLNADFSSFESAYLTYFCFYGIGLLEEFCNNIPTIRAFNSEQEFKDTYKDIFDQSKIKLKEYKFDLENNNLKGKWIGIFKELPNGNIELDFTEEIEVNNFIMKIFAKSYLKSQQKRYMRDLERALNKQ